MAITVLATGNIFAENIAKCSITPVIQPNNTTAVTSYKSLSFEVDLEDSAKTLAVNLLAHTNKKGTQYSFVPAELKPLEPASSILTIKVASNGSLLSTFSLGGLASTGSWRSTVLGSMLLTQERSFHDEKLNAIGTAVLVCQAVK